MNPLLTVLSYGGGQDSDTLLEHYIQDEAGFRSKYAPRDFAVVMSNTGDEHPLTYQHVRSRAKQLKELKIPFFLLDPEDGYHLESWPSLSGWYRRTRGLQTKSCRKSCTDNLKIKPIYNWLDQYVADRYGGSLWVGKAKPESWKFDTYQFKDAGKKAIKKFAEIHGRINMIIGIAAGEERRIRGKASGKKYIDDTTTKLFPLVDLGLDRAGCHQYLRSKDRPIPPPSNCMKCPFMDLIELLWLYRFHSDVFWDWCQDEAAKIEKFRGKILDKNGFVDESKNHGVWGKANYTLIDALMDAERTFGHMSNEELDEHKMSHGHCVMSKY